MKLYFVRHGQTDANVAGVNNPKSGHSEPLNPVGIQQSYDLAKELKDIKFDAIISSTSRRCVETAEILNKYHKLNLIFDDAWKEIQTNGYVDFATWSELCTFDTDTALNNIEPLQEFFKRIYHALDKLTKDYRGKTVLLVSHGGVQNAIYTYVKKLPLEGDIHIAPMKNCECRVYDF